MMDTPLPPRARRANLKRIAGWLTVLAIAIVVFWVLIGIVTGDKTDSSLQWLDVERGDVVISSPGIGQFISTRERLITASETGFVDTIHYSIGDFVESGDVLISLISPQLDQERNSAEIEARREQLISTQALETAGRQVDPAVA